MWNILVFIVVSLLAGFIARALVPGRDPMSVPMTIALGAIGSFVGGVLAVVFSGREWGEFQAVGVIGSIIGAIVVLLLYRKFGNKLKR